EDLLGIIHYSGSVAAADRRCASPYDMAAETVEEIRGIKKQLDLTASAKSDRRN
ncbi:MAG: hypothetical protein GX942_09095, partial [Papillibacter sp.]|nr:hypothetical protein [Papillibacter sp.]